MKNENSDRVDSGVEEAVWQEKRRRISTVWIVPIVALVVGAWLMYQSFSERGPTIEIVFKSAAGINAEKTVVKYKDIEVGKVSNVTFSKDLSTVIVTAELKKNMEPFLSENTRFWVMQARLSMNEVQGLDTLLSGVYIVIDPQKGDTRVKEFKGLDHIPVVSSKEKGRTYILKANDLGSLDIGSPIYYKKLKAGSVASYKLDPDGKSVSIKVFVKSPFDKLVTERTRFWNAGGITANIGADGIEIRTESLTSIMSGGLAFDNFKEFGDGERAEKNHLFDLYPSHKTAQKVTYKRELYFWVYFNHSIRGLSGGAPVEFRGVKIGEVVNFSLVGDAETAEFKIPILIKIEPERFQIVGKRTKGNSVNEAVFKKLIDNGFSAQLQSGNLLTGELFVDLDLRREVKGSELKKENGYYVIPTVPATIETLKSDIKTLLDRLAGIPFEEIGKEMQLILKDIRGETIPLVDQTIESTNGMMKSVDSSVKSLNRNYLDNNAQINKKMIRLLEEMTGTSRSVKNLTDYLERHPESLIKGK